MNTAKRVAYASLAAGFVTQAFFDIGSLFLPSMASAEGVAVYPATTTVLGGFLYRLAPYLVFSGALWIAEQRRSRFAGWVAVASIVGVMLPIIAIGVATIIGLSTTVFRERFWPVRPLVQCLSFALLLLAVMMFDRFRRKVARPGMLASGRKA